MDIYFNRETVITFPENDNLPDITEGIAEGSLLVDEVLFTDRFTIGKCHSNRFEVELFNFPTIGKEKIYVYQNVYESPEDEEPTEVPIFTGYVDSCLTNRGRYEDSKQIVAYDLLYSIGTTDVAEWWEQIFDLTTQVSVKDLRDSLCDFVGIDYENVTLPNDDVMISQTQQLDIISFSSVLGYIMQINGANAYVSREGVLQFFAIRDNAPIEIDETYAQNTSEFDSYTVPAYETVRIANTTEGIVGESGEGTNVLLIEDNVLLLDKTAVELQTIAENILAVVITMTYKPAKIDMICSDLSILPGDRVSISDVIYLVCDNELSGSQLVDQTISSLGENTIEDTPSEYDAKTKDIQEKLNSTGMKYYKYQLKKARVINSAYPIVAIRYTCTEMGIVIFHGCVVMDIELIDDTLPGTIELQYVLNNTPVREYVPTETYFQNGRHTMQMLHFWETDAGLVDTFKVNLIPTNCKVTVGAFKCEGYMEGSGLAGEGAWDGYIEASDNFTEIDFASEPTVVTPYDEEVVFRSTEPVSISAEDNFEPVTLETEATVCDFQEIVYINKKAVGTLTWQEVFNIEGGWQELYEDYLW